MKFKSYPNFSGRNSNFEKGKNEFNIPNLVTKIPKCGYTGLLGRWPITQ